MAKALPRFWALSSNFARRYFSTARLWDVIALLIVAFAIWKTFIAPRSFLAPYARPAPIAVFSRLDGSTFRVVDHRGHLVFLDFYASWCEPCKIELPLVETWAAKHADAVVVPVDVGETRAVADSFARRLQLRHVALDPQSSAPALFGIEGFPTVVVIDPRGYIRAKWEGLNPAIALAMTNAEKKL